MAIELHRSDQPAILASEFAAMLAEAPGDVFEPELVVVPARGVERWLAQRLSHTLGASLGDDGVSAGLRIMAPGSLISLLLDRDRDDVWQADQLVWPTLDAIDDLTGTAHFDAMTHHLGAGPPITDDPEAEWNRKARQSRRYAVARRVAGLFASYARERPSLLADWEAGNATDGQGNPLPDDFAWQPILWRTIVESILAAGAPTESPIQRHNRVVSQLSSGTADLDLPQRISFFGYTRLAASELELLFALGKHRDVHLWLPHPSPALWQDLSARDTNPSSRADDDSAQSAHHPLLATLGRDVRELQQVLDDPGLICHEPTTSAQPGNSRLALLQNDIRVNRAPDPARSTTNDDLSIQVHACHGRARQVEVLREVLTWLIAEHKGGLQPRDILVMCPDIEQFAPLIQATFGISLVSSNDRQDTAYHPGQQLRVQLADRSPAATNSLIDLAHRVVALVAGRMTASEMLDLASHPTVRQRFGFDEESLARITQWVSESGVRWGYDVRHRAEYGLTDIDANTWKHGLDRLALGVAAAADTEGSVGSRVPIDDLGSRDIETGGRFIELVERLKVAADAVRSGALTVADWMQWLHRTIESLADVPDDQRWQFTGFARDLASISASADERTTLRLTDIRVLLEQRWGSRPTRANFRTGAVTVCTMVPMRSVPHKAVVVLGVDDGVYPRSPIVDGDDVLARDPRVGERDARSEDRQLLLDAVMAAGERFVAIYSGFDERNGTRRPPAVPLQELIATAARTATAPADSDASTTDDLSFVRTHPLQAFDERNFAPDGPMPGGTFDHASLAGAQALREMRSDPPAPRTLVPEPLEIKPIDAVTIDDLTSFLTNPAREFLRRRLELSVPWTADESDDSLPIALSGLEQWGVGERVLEQVLDGITVQEALDREVARGSIPTGALGERVRNDVADNVESIAQHRADGEPRSVDVRLDLPGADNVRLTGVVRGIHDDTLWVRTYSQISAKHIAVAWVQLLALAAAEPERTHQAQLQGKKGGQMLRSPGAERSLHLLADLTKYRQSGLRFPMGVPPKTASAFARAYRPGGDPTALRRAMDRVRSTWEGDRFPGENDDPWWTLVLGRNAPVEELNRGSGLEYFGPHIWQPIHEHGGDA